MIQTICRVCADPDHPEMPVEAGISSGNRHDHSKLKTTSVFNIHDKRRMRIGYFVTTCLVKVYVPDFSALWNSVWHA